jgi:hypothetical protein
MVKDKEIFAMLGVGQKPSLNKLLDTLESKGFEYSLQYKKVEGLHDYQILLTKGLTECGFGAETKREVVIHALKMLHKMKKL